LKQAIYPKKRKREDPEWYDKRDERVTERADENEPTSYDKRLRAVWKLMRGNPDWSE
jgi:hypothetical protein